jgi:hypothetical protein
MGQNLDDAMLNEFQEGMKPIGKGETLGGTKNLRMGKSATGNFNGVK